MATLGNVFDTMNSVKDATEMFGSDEGFRREYQARIMAIAAAICQEQRVSSQEALNLLPETPLCDSASGLLYDELLGWLATQHSTFKG